MLLGLGQVEWTGSADESLIVTAWTALTVLDLSHNSITNIDESVVSFIPVNRHAEIACILLHSKQCKLLSFLELTKLKKHLVHNFF